MTSMPYLSMVCKYHSSGSFTPGQARGTLPDDHIEIYSKELTGMISFILIVFEFSCFLIVEMTPSKHDQYKTKNLCQ